MTSVNFNFLVNSFTREEILEIYKDMLLLRRFEERAGSAYGQKLISGFCHLYIGQEAGLMGLYKAMRKEDHIITAYRCHAHAILYSRNPNAVMAELFGKKTGSSGGKGGSMHIFSPENNFWGGHGIVGAQVSLGTGIAFAEKYKGTQNICATFLGDGAANQGQVYESFNMASLWNIPVLYVIENNGYAMGTSCARHSASGADFSKRGEAFGIKGEIVDGMDFVNVYRRCDEIINQMRQDSRPYILQINNYRYRGHSMSDPAKYRTVEEVNSYKEKDPIINFKQHVLNLFKEEEIEKCEDAVMQIVDEAYEFAINSPLPSEDTLFTNVI